MPRHLDREALLKQIANEPNTSPAHHTTRAHLDNLIALDLEENLLVLARATTCSAEVLAKVNESIAKVHESQKAALDAQLAATAAEDKLSARLLWLNYVLTAATVVMAIPPIVDFYQWLTKEPQVTTSPQSDPASSTPKSTPPSAPSPG